MPRTPRPLTSALAAALAAGTVVAVSAVAEPGSDRASRVSAPKGWRVAPPPTRQEAIQQASAARDELERALAKELGLEPGKVRVAQRTIVAKRLAEEVDAERLTPAQRDALMACFDDPLGCDRGKLPISRLPGGAEMPFAQGLAAPGLVVPPPSLARRLPQGTTREARRLRRSLARRQATLRRQRTVRVPHPLLIGGPDAELARELGVDLERLARALRKAMANGVGRPPRVDPDGVPLGLPSLPYPLTVALPPQPVPAIRAPTERRLPTPRPVAPGKARPLRVSPVPTTPALPPGTEAVPPTAPAAP